jgi:hypothetical protein
MVEDVLVPMVRASVRRVVMILVGSMVPAVDPFRVSASRYSVAELVAVAPPEWVK